MRCENCGWENSNENLKCEKCGAQLAKSSDSSTMRQTIHNFSDTGFDSKKTQKGCPECGYPMRPSEHQCPQCGNAMESKETVSDSQKKSSPLPLSPKPKGTVIINISEEEEQSTRTFGRKIVGFLITYSHSSLGEFFPLYEGRNSIGKDNSMDVQIIGDEAVSSKHLNILFRPVDHKFKFKDDQSTNGTFLNGELTDEGELVDKDCISIGSTKLIFMAIPEMKDV